jgi:hypothetical protein
MLTGNRTDKKNADSFNFVSQISRFCRSFLALLLLHLFDGLTGSFRMSKAW